MISLFCSFSGVSSIAVQQWCTEHHKKPIDILPSSFSLLTCVLVVVCFLKTLFFIFLRRCVFFSSMFFFFVSFLFSCFCHPPPPLSPPHPPCLRLQGYCLFRSYNSKHAVPSNVDFAEIFSMYSACDSTRFF